MRALSSLSAPVRVVGTVLRSAAWAGQRGIEALSEETIAKLRERGLDPDDLEEDEQG